MNEITVTGMVLSSMPIGEYDRRLEILTTEYGRISTFARNARRPSSPLVSCSRVFAFGKFTFYRGQSSYNLNLAKISNFFTELSNDFDAGCYASYFLEVARYFTHENMNATDELKLIYQSFRALINESLENKLVRAIFEMKMLDVSGIFKYPKEKELSEACEYAINFVINSNIAKLYTFRLKEDVLKEFSDIAAEMMAKVVDVKFKSLELLDISAI